MWRIYVKRNRKMIGSNKSQVPWDTNLLFFQVVANSEIPVSWLTLRLESRSVDINNQMPQSNPTTQIMNKTKTYNESTEEDYLFWLFADRIYDKNYRTGSSTYVALLKPTYSFPAIFFKKFIICKRGTRKGKSNAKITVPVKKIYRNILINDLHNQTSQHCRPPAERQERKNRHINTVYFLSNIKRDKTHFKSNNQNN